MFSWYKYLIVSLVFSHLGFLSRNLFLIAPFPDICLLVPFYRSIFKNSESKTVRKSHFLTRALSCSAQLVLPYTCTYCIYHSTRMTMDTPCYHQYICYMAYVHISYECTFLTTRKGHRFENKIYSILFYSIL